jgi:hypothetical protein
VAMFAYGWELGSNRIVCMIDDSSMQDLYEDIKTDQTTYIAFKITCDNI